MPSRDWLNLLLWGLGEKLVGRGDYRTDILMLINAMTWLTIPFIPFLFPNLGPSGALFVWVALPIFGPIYWLGTQVIVGAALVRWGRREDS